MLDDEIAVEVYPIRTLPRFTETMAKENDFTWFD
jgi:hypothetical protein